MDKELILKNIGKHIQLNPDEQEFFLAQLRTQTIKRKQLYLHRGEICSYSTFVVRGCLRGYTIDDNGLEHVLSFAPADWWIADMYSFISQEPAYLNIDALEDSVVLRLSKENLEKLYAEVPKFERYFRILVEKSLVAHQQRLLNNMTFTAEERYQEFCRLYPSLIDRLPQKQIAAYLGVSPEFFSRMRSKLLRRS